MNTDFYRQLYLFRVFLCFSVSQNGTMPWRSTGFHGFTATGFDIQAQKDYM